MERRLRGPGRFSPYALAAPGLGLLLLLPSVTVTGCGTAQTSSQSESSSSLQSTITSTPETTTTTLPVSIPAEFSQFRGLVERLQAQGVAVAELRQMPSSEDYGTGVEVVLRSQSTGQKGTPEDAIGSRLVFRAAVLEKMAGTKIDGVAVAYLKPSGEIVFSHVVPVDRTIDATWYATPGLSLEEVTQRATTDVSTRLSSSAFEIVEVRATQDPDGTRVLWAKLTVSSIAIANDSIDDPSRAVGAAVGALNERNQAKIGVIRTEIDTIAGEPVLWAIGDLQLEGGTWWEAEGITEGVYPRPAPAPNWTTSTGSISSGNGASTVPAPVLPEQMPADFGLVAEWWRNSLDTFAGTFTKDLVLGSPIIATAELSLTREEMEKIYQELVAIDILSYPADFAPPYAEVTTPGTEVMVSPVINYHLRLTAAGIEKDISWRDVNGSSTREAVALRDWFRKLMDLITSKPEYKAMPPARGGYA